MTKITGAQVVVLAQARAGPGGMIDLPEDGKLVKTLIKKGLAILVPAGGGGSRLLITAAGRGALPPQPVGVEPPCLAESRETAIEDWAGEERAPNADGPAAVGRSGRPQGKLGVLVELLQRPQGATMGNMMAATGWQAHSVRGAMSGALKRRLGLAIESGKPNADRVYRIASRAVCAGLD